MVRSTLPIALSLALSLVGSAAIAQDRGGRYTLSPVDGGFLRLDTVTGAISMCSRKQDQWSCEPVNDAAREEAQKLRSENKDLKAEMKRMEEMILGDTKPAPPAAPGSGPRVDLPKEEDIDRAIDGLERIFKKYRERLREFDRSLSEPNRTPPSSPAPGQAPAPATPSVPEQKSL